MLVKLLPEQIARHWKVIKYAIDKSLPPTAAGGEGRYERILMKLLIEDMQCWISYNKKQTKISGILTTMFSGDGALGTRNLLVYSMYGTGISEKDFGEGLLTLIRFARSNGCTKVVAFSESRSVNNIFAKIGAEVNFKFISIPIE